MSNRICRLIGIIIALLSLTEAAAFAGWKGAVIGQDTNGTVTVDTAGTSHIVTLTAYKAFDLVYTTVTQRGVRGPILKSNVGLIRPQAMAIATDSKNRPYVAIVNADERKIPYLFYLNYLVFNGHGWDTQVIDNDVEDLDLNVQIILDFNNRPHIFYVKSNGLLTHAYFDGSAWHFENVGVPVAPTAVMIGPDGTFHVAGVMFTPGQGDQVCEERGLNGSWTGECFDFAGQGAPALGLGSDGTPEVVYGSVDDDPEYFDTVKRARFDGTNWSIDTIFEASTYSLKGEFQAAYYAIDRSGLVKFFIGTYEGDLDYFAQDGNSWDLTDLGKGVDFGSTSLFIPVFSLALDPTGLPHIVFAPNLILTNEIFYQFYAALSLPYLTDQWAGVTSHTVARKTRITGKLTVNNSGTAAASGGFVVKYYLSADDQLDAGDNLLGSTKLTIASGQHRVLTYAFTPTGAVSGEYVIAQIVAPSPQDIANPNNQTAVALIP
jgi:hypothetical protein